MKTYDKPRAAGDLNSLTPPPNGGAAHLHLIDYRIRQNPARMIYHRKYPANSIWHEYLSPKALEELEKFNRVLRKNGVWILNPSEEVKHD